MLYDADPCPHENVTARAGYVFCAGRRCLECESMFARVAQARYLSLLSGLLVSGLFVLADSAHAEVMKEFHSDIVIEGSGKAEVVETLKMDFQGEERHGIIRHIPVRVVRHNKSYSMDLVLESITDGDGHSLRYRELKDGPEVLFKIGDPTKISTGTQTYQLKYRLKRVINFIKERPEFYWNVTGSEWAFPIEKTEVTVAVPSNIPLNLVSVVAYQGPPGSTTQAKMSQSNEQLKFSCADLLPGSGLTIGVSMPPGTITEPMGLQRFADWFVDWWPAVVFPMVGFSTMYALWYQSGRDEDGDKPAPVEWAPPKELTPAEVGTLVDERCDLTDITSTLVDLAVRGHLKIKQLKTDSLFFMSNKDYEFEKTDPPAGSTPLKPFEVMFLNGIFERQVSGTKSLLSNLRGSFAPTLRSVGNAIYDSLTTQKIFRHNPDSTRAIYMSAAVVLFFIGICSFVLWQVLALGVVTTAIIIACFSPAMPARTRKGSELKRQSLGFARFVQETEKERIRLLAQDDPTIFGRLLPYAMVLGAADRWADAFKDLGLQPPDWYTSADPYPNYSTPIFVNDLGNGLRTIEKSLIVVPAGAASSAWSGGSAFDGGGSGGGFGGGGGSSW
jgi:uncharacterized membrane protein